MDHSSPAMKSTAEKLRWLYQITCDPEVSGSALNVAVVLACDYVNRETVDRARPAVAAIAAKLGVHEKSARRALHSLADRGHLTIKRRPGYENDYCLTVKTGAR